MEVMQGNQCPRENVQWEDAGLLALTKRMETGYTGNIRQPDHSSVQHPVAPLEAALPAIFKALRLPSGIKPPGNRSLGYRGMLGLSI